MSDKNQKILPKRSFCEQISLNPFAKFDQIKLFGFLLKTLFVHETDFLIILLLSVHLDHCMIHFQNMEYFLTIDNNKHRYIFYFLIKTP